MSDPPLTHPQIIMTSSAVNYFIEVMKYELDIAILYNKVSVLLKKKLDWTQYSKWYVPLTITLHLHCGRGGGQ